MEITPRMLSVAEAAAYCGLAEKTVRNRISRRAVLSGAVTAFPVKPKRIGKRVLFDRQDLDRWLDGLEVDG